MKLNSEEENLKREIGLVIRWIALFAYMIIPPYAILSSSDFAVKFGQSFLNLLGNPDASLGTAYGILGLFYMLSLFLFAIIFGNI